MDSPEVERRIGYGEGIVVIALFQRVAQLHDATNGIVHQLNGVDAARRIAGVAGLPLDTDGVGHMAFVRAYRLQRGWFADDGAIRA